MGLIGDGKKRKSWQQLSFGRQQTKTGALEQERASSRRVLRLGYVLLHILFVSGLIILDRFVGPVPLSPEQMIEEGLVLFGMVLLIHGVMVSVIRSFHPEVLEGRTQLRQFALILAGTLAVARVLVYHDWIPSPYLVPFPLVAMTIALIHSARFAVHAMAGILVMFGLMLATGAMAILARSVPEMNVFILGFTIRILLGLFTVWMILPLVGEVFAAGMQVSVEMLDQLLLMWRG